MNNDYNLVPAEHLLRSDGLAVHVFESAMSNTWSFRIFDDTILEPIESESESPEYFGYWRTAAKGILMPAGAESANVAMMIANSFLKQLQADRLRERRQFLLALEKLNAAGIMTRPSEDLETMARQMNPNADTASLITALACHTADGRPAFTIDKSAFDRFELGRTLGEIGCSQIQARTFLRFLENSK